MSTDQATTTVRKQEEPNTRTDEELRTLIEKIIEDKTKPASDGTVEGIAEAADKIISELGMSMDVIPGGVSDYSPFTGEPVVQPDRWAAQCDSVFRL